VKLLLDTHLLLWAADDPNLLPSLARDLMADTGNELIFSTVSLWEIAIKSGLKRHNIRADPRILRRRMLDNAYLELPLFSTHAVAIDTLPPIHQDPFDRILIAQAMVEGITLLTVDPVVARYPGPVKKV
jgi:PIN domain nuclease of toxin-antitoxin system